MTDKERLEEHTHIAVKKDEYKKLKEQAERVQELEEWRNEVTNHVVKRNDEYAKCREQNKRYREAILLAVYELGFALDEAEIDKTKERILQAKLILRNANVLEEIK